jgi:hypothetical protein
MRAIMEAAKTSETSVNFYQTTQRNNPENSHLHTRRRENLKFHKIYINNTVHFKTSTPLHTFIFPTPAHLNFNITILPTGLHHIGNI